MQSTATTPVDPRERGAERSDSVRRAVALLAAAMQALRERCRRTRERFDFEQLDARTLHDLGLERSEFDSCWREARHEPEPTRLRIARAQAHGAWR